MTANCKSPLRPIWRTLLPLLLFWCYDTRNKFETRYRNHIKSLPNKKFQNDKELSPMWKLKSKNHPVKIKWSMVKQGRRTRIYRLCFEEKLLMMKGRRKNLLNKQSEIFSKCGEVTLLSCALLLQVAKLNAKLIYNNNNNNNN